MDLKQDLCLQHIFLYEVVGEAIHLGKISIVPAFYELNIDRNEDESGLSFPLAEYVAREHPLRTRLFRQLVSETCSLAECDALWVRAKISAAYKFSPPSAVGWRYELLNIPFLAVIFDRPNSVFSIHPFVCIEENLKAGLEFYPLTSPEQRTTIARAFWGQLILSPGLASFFDRVLGD